MPRKVAIPLAVVGTAFRTSDGHELGLARGRLRNKDVQHAFHGGSSLGLDHDSVIQLCRAYEPLLRADQFFSHTTAALLHGIPLPDTSPHPLHVSCTGAAPPRRAGVSGHQVEAVGLMFVAGLPVVSAADTWCQLATILCQEDLVAAGDYLISGIRLSGGRRTPPKCSPAELAAAVQRYGARRGAVRLVWALPRLRTGVDSRMESRLRLLLVAAGLPEPIVGLGILVDHARLLLHGDLAYERWQMLFEYEGDDHRLGRRRFLSDIERRELFEAAQWRVVRVTSNHLFVEPEAFIARVKAIIRLRESASW